MKRLEFNPTTSHAGTAFRAVPRPVLFTLNNSDRNVAILGEIGMSTAFIAQETGLTQSQVVYRLSKAQIRRRDYRNGDSAIASLIVEKVVRFGSNEKMVRDIEEQVRKGLEEKGLR